MTNLDNELLKNKFLKAVKDMGVSSESLFSIFSEMKEKTPEVFQEYIFDEVNEEIDENPLNWSSKYFSKFLILVNSNFSIKRIDNLLQVRDKMRRDGVKSFLPPNKNKSNSIKENKRTDESYMVSSNLKKYIKEKDDIGIRTVLRLDLNNNKISKNQLLKSIELVKKTDIDVFRSYEVKTLSGPIDENIKNWTVSYYDSQVTFLRLNFSEKRLRHLIDVRETFREQGLDGFKPESPKPRSQAHPSTSNDQPHKSSSNSANEKSAPNEIPPALKAALTIGGAIAAVALIIIGLMR